VYNALDSASLLNNGINDATRKLNKTLYENRDYIYIQLYASFSAMTCHPFTFG
jgi:hypothetical protein